MAGREGYKWNAGTGGRACPHQIWPSSLTPPRTVEHKVGKQGVCGDCGLNAKGRSINHCLHTFRKYSRKQTVSKSRQCRKIVVRPQDPTLYLVPGAKAEKQGAHGTVCRLQGESATEM